MKGTRFLALALAAIITITGSGNIYTVEASETEGTNTSTSEELTEGDYTYTVTDGCATITAYNGTDETVVTPTKLGGYPVTIIGEKAFSGKNVVDVTVSEGIIRIKDSAFWKCYLLEKLTLPSTVQVLEYDVTTETTALKEIKVSSKNTVFFDQDGVLFKYVMFGSAVGITLYTYPAAKAGETYRVPYFCQDLMAWSFSDVQNLKELYVPYTVTSISQRTFCSGKNAVDVYLNHDKTPEVDPELFFDMPAGCHVVVKNEQIKTALDAIDLFSKAEGEYETPDSSVVVLGTEGYPAIPTTSLTWDGTNTTGTHILAPAEKCQLTYVQEPFNSTDNITWSSSNEKIARVNSVTGLVEASGGTNYPVQTGTCTITGTDESGHSISVDVTVYKAVTDVELAFGEYSNPTSYTVVLDSENNTQWIELDASPSLANNAGNVTWTSSNPTVATVVKDEEETGYALMTYLSAGTTTITATLNDNGTIWTRSFVLTVTKPATEEPGTENNGPGNNGSTNNSSTNNSSTNNSNTNNSNTNNSNSNTNSGNSNSGNTTTQKSQTITGVSSTYKKVYGVTPFSIKAKAKGKVTYVSSNKKVATVTSTGKVTVKGTGECTITITAAATKTYKKATKKVTIYVAPKKETTTYAKSTKKKQLTVKWKKDTQATGYQIQYSTSKKFTKNTTRTVTVKSNSATSRTLKNLKAGKKYYVRVRAYKTTKVSGKSKTLYGSYSTVKPATVKK